MKTPDRHSHWVYWDETERYADASFKVIMWLVGIGSAIIGVLSLMAEDFAPLKLWLCILLAFEGSWLLLTGSVVLCVKSVEFLRSRTHARRTARPGGP
jgi:hypothetical protein